MSAFGKIGQAISGMPGMNTMMKPVQGFMNKSPIMRHSPLMQHMQNRFGQNPQQKSGIGPSPNAQPMQQMAQGFGEFAQARLPEQEMPYQQMEGPQNTGIMKPGIPQGPVDSSMFNQPGQLGGQNAAQNAAMYGQKGGLGPSMGGLGQMMQNPNPKKMMPQGPPKRDPNAAQF